MSVMESDQLVDDYLQRLEAAAAHLQRSRRAELVAEIREHIEAALRQEDAANEVAVRNVLERLGPPEEIVEAAEPPPAEAPTKVGKLEIGALIALLVPVLGWLVGIVLVLVSEAWSRRDKAIGIGLVLLVMIVPALTFVAAAAEDGSSRGVPVGTPEDPPSGEALGALEVLVVMLFVFFGGLPSAIFLGWRLRRSKGLPATQA